MGDYGWPLVNLEDTERDYGVGSRSVEAHRNDLAKTGIHRSFTREQIEPILKSVLVFFRFE